MNGNTTTTLSGFGGSGGGGLNYGVEMNGAVISYGTNNTLNFSNCLGGSGSGGNNYGVTFSSNLFVNGAINFTNVVGGSGGTANHGVFIPSGVTVTAPTLIGRDVEGGGSIGFYLNGGAFGSTGTNQIYIQAGSVGIGSNEVGIQIDNSGQMIVGDGGTMTLVGTGGGIYNGNGGSNYGVNLTSATLSAGIATGPKSIRSILQALAAQAVAAIIMALRSAVWQRSIYLAQISIMQSTS